MSHRMFLLLYLLVVLKPLNVAAQQESLRIRLLFNKAPLLLGKAYALRSGDSVRITRFRFYISQPQLTTAKGTSVSLPEFYHLVDADDTSSLHLVFSGEALTTLQRLSFNLGVDSARSVSGVQTGALDPRRGMYWAWNSGYINLQLEGLSTQSPAPNKCFEYHLGGYAAPNKALRRIELRAEDNANPAGKSQTPLLCVDVGTWLYAIDLHTTHSVMVPGPQAMRLCTTALNMFSLIADEKK